MGTNARDPHRSAAPSLPDGTALERGYLLAGPATREASLVSELLRGLAHLRTHRVRTPFVGAETCLDLPFAQNTPAGGLPSLRAERSGPHRTMACGPLCAMPPMVG